MQQRRSKIVAIGIILGLAGTLLPIAAMNWVSFQIAQRNAVSVLDSYADTALERASQTFHYARQSLVTVGQSKLIPCSDAHIAMMRDETINSAFVDEIGYFSDNILRCTSWGHVQQFVERQQTDFTTAGGASVTLRVKPTASFQGEMIAIYRGDYGALINPSTFVDITVKDGMSTALLTQKGQLLGERSKHGKVNIHDFVLKEQSGFSEGAAFSVKKRDGLSAIVIDSNPRFGQPRIKEQFFLLSVGAITGIFLAGIVYRNARQRLTPQAELAFAIRRNELVVHYQPIVEMKSGICIGAEALVRWHRPDGSVTRPDQFIPLAEEAGLITLLTDAIIDHIIVDLGKLLVNDRSLHIAINVSAGDIQSGRIIDALAEKLNRTGIQTQQIWLEATERGFIDIHSARSTLERARRAGHSVAIDDFGTGYSSLQYLQGLPLDALKIDKSFVDTISKDTATCTVTLHIIRMAKELGLFTIAEGVETPEQAEFLKGEGVDFAQGWHYSKALPAGEFLAYHCQNKITFGSA